MSLLLAALLPTQGARATVSTDHHGEGQAPVVVALVESDGAFAQELGRGAEAAVRVWNREHPATPLALRVLETQGPWRGEGHALADLILRERVAAVIGPVEDAEAHLVAQVATRLRVPVLSLSAAPSLRAAGDPWIFPMVPDYAEQLRAVVGRARSSGACRRVAWVRSVQRGGRPEGERERELRQALDELEVDLVSGSERPDAVLLAGDLSSALAELAGNGERGSGAAFLAGTWLMRASLVDAAEAAHVRVFLPSIDGAEGARLSEVAGTCVRAVGIAVEENGRTPAAVRKGLAASRRAGTKEQPSTTLTLIRGRDAELGSNGGRDPQATHAPPGGQKAPQEGPSRSGASHPETATVTRPAPRM